MQQPPLRLPNSGSFSLEPDRGRAHVAKEILTSEKSYIYNLELCLTAMYLPIKEKINANAHSAMRLTRRRENFATLEELDKIFSCLDTLQKQHVKFCEKLDQRVLNWTAESCIGDIFLQETAFFAEYVRYANQFSVSSETLFTCRRRKAFNTFLEHLEFSTGVMLPSFLIMPIQRLPRYELLLKELLKYTEETSNDFMDIPIALKQLKKHTKKTNIAVHCTLSQVSAEFNREQLNAGIAEDKKVEEGTHADAEEQQEEAHKLTPDVLPRVPSPEVQGSTVERDSPEKKHIEEEETFTGLGTLKAENLHRPRPKSMSLVLDQNSQKGQASLEELRLKETFAPVAEEEELKFFNSPDSPLRRLSRSKEAAQEKTKRRRSLLLFATSSHNKEKNKPEKDKAASCSAFFVEDINKEARFERAEAAAAEAASASLSRANKRRSFRLTWSSFGDFKETIATSFQEFQKEEDMLQAKKEAECAKLHLSSDGSADLLHSSDSLDGAVKTPSRIKTKKEEKEAEKERKKSARRSRDGSSLSQSSPMPSSASASSVATPTTPGRKLSRLVGSMLDMKNRHNKEDSGEWKLTGHDYRDKIETQG